MSDLGEEFAKICIQWLKKALVYGSEFWTMYNWPFSDLEHFYYQWRIYGGGGGGGGGFRWFKPPPPWAAK